MSDTEIGTEISVIENTMRERPAEYFKSGEMQQRYRNLLDAREAGGTPAVPAQRGSGGASRRAEIERIMKSDRAGYFKNEALQREYYDLLAADLPAESGEETRPVAARPAAAQPEAQQPPAANSAEARAILGEHEPETLERAGGKVGAIFGALAEGSAARDLEATFNALPPAVRSGIVAEMGRVEPGYIKHATIDEIAAIRTMPGMAELLRHWGTSAPRKLAVALEGYNRFRAGLSAEDRKQFVGFWAHLPAREKVLTLWAMGGA
jgi:hypothetical protein